MKTAKPDEPNMTRSGILNSAHVHLLRALGKTPLLTGAIWFLSGVASLTMLAGMIDLNDHPNVLSVLLAIGLAVTVTITINYAVLTLFRKRSSVAARSGALLMWLACASLSTLFGYGAWFAFASSGSHSQKGIDSAARSIITPMTAFSVAYGELVATANDVSAYSDTQATTELETGGSCLGSDAGPLEGPRRRLRQRDQAKFKGFADRFTRQGKIIQTAINHANQATESYDPAKHNVAIKLLREAFDQAKATESDPSIRDWSATINARIAEGQGQIVDPQTGQSFVCGDPTLSAKLSTAAAVSLPKLPAALPDIDAPTHQASVRRAFDIVGGDAQYDGRIDAIPFGAGAFIDLVVLFLAFLRAQRDPYAGDERRDAGSGGDSPKHIRDSLLEPSALASLAPQLANLMSANPWRFLQVLQRNAIEERGYTWIVEPIGVVSADATALGRAIRILQRAGSLKFWSRSEIADLPFEYAALAIQTSPEATMVKLYRIDTTEFIDLEVDWIRSVTNAGPSPDAPIFFSTDPKFEDA